MLQDGKGKISPFLSRPNKYKRHIRKPAYGFQSKATGGVMNSQRPLSSLSLKGPWPHCLDTYEHVGVRESMWMTSVLFQLPLLSIQFHTELCATRILQKTHLVCGCAQIHRYPRAINEGQKLVCTVICTWIFPSYYVTFVNSSVNLSAAFWVRHNLSQSITLPIGSCREWKCKIQDRLWRSRQSWVFLLHVW